MGSCINSRLLALLISYKRHAQNQAKPTPSFKRRSDPYQAAQEERQRPQVRCSSLNSRRRRLILLRRRRQCPEAVKMELRLGEERSRAVTVNVPWFIVEKREDWCRSVLEVLNIFTVKVSSVIVPVRVFFGGVDHMIIRTTCSHTASILSLIPECHSFGIIGECCRASQHSITSFAAGQHIWDLLRGVPNLKTFCSTCKSQVPGRGCPSSLWRTDTHGEFLTSGL